MNVADHTPSLVNYGSAVVTEGLLLPATGTVGLGTMSLGGGSGFGLPFEKIANPEYAWRVTRDLEPHPPCSNVNFRPADRVLVRIDVPDGRIITISCTGKWSLWDANWQQLTYFQMQGGYGDAFPDYVDRGDLYLTVGIGDAGGGMLGFTGSLISSILGELNVGGAIVGWDIPQGALPFYAGMLPRAAMQSLRPYLFSYCNR